MVSASIALCHSGQSVSLQSSTFPVLLKPERALESAAAPRVFALTRIPSSSSSSFRRSGAPVWMWSHLLARRTRSLVKSLPSNPRAQRSTTHSLRYPRKDSAPSQSPTPRLSRRAISSETISTQETPETSTPPPAPTEPPPNAEELPLPEDPEEKPKRRTRVSAAKEAVDSIALPSGLKNLWS